MVQIGSSASNCLRSSSQLLSMGWKEKSNRRWKFSCILAIIRFISSKNEREVELSKDGMVQL